MVRVAKPCDICHRVAPTRSRLTCSRCDTQTHTGCLEFTPRHVAHIETWYCLSCQAERNCQITYKQSRTDVQVLQPSSELNQANERSLVNNVSDQATTAGQNVEAQTTHTPSEPIPGPSRPRLVVRIPRNAIRKPTEPSDSSQSNDGTEPHTPSQVSESENVADEFQVEDITDVRTKEGREEYLVLWHDRTTSWEPESHLGVGCGDLVARIRQAKNLPSVKFTSAFGALEDHQGLNPLNWRPIEDVLEAINHFDKKGTIPAMEFTRALEQPFLALLGHRAHLYVVYRHEIEGDLFVADGGNYYVDDADTKAQVDALLGESAVGLRFIGQSAVDFCASSAVLIAIAFRKAFRTRTQPTIIKAERTMASRVQRNFHPYASRTIPKSGPFLNITPDVCPYCKKQFKGRNRRKFTGHVTGHENRGRKAE